MTCPNCHSNDIITVQDGNFCISCGQLVPKDAVLAAETAAAAKPKRRKPGRPKAGRLDVPVAVTAKVTAEVPAAEPTPPVITHFAADAPAAEPEPEPVPAEPEVVVPAPPPTLQPPPVVAATAVTPAAPAAPRLRPVHHGRRSLSDIAPRKPAAHHKADAELEAPEAPPAKAQKVKQPAGPPVPLGDVESASLHERVRPITLSWSLVPATFLALLAGGAALALLQGKLDATWTATQAAGWAVWGEVALVLGLYYVSHSLVSGALTFGASRRAAHRPVPAGRQFSVAINSFAPRLFFDLLILVLQAAVAAAAVGLMIVGGAGWGVPEWAQLAGLFVAFLALAYLFAGLHVTQGLGRVALTLAPLSLWRALVVCWALFRRHFELVGFRVISLILELLLLVPFAALAVALVMYLPASFDWAAASGIAVLAIIAGGLLGAGTTAWWESAYRHLVEHDRAAAAVRLLAGRPAEKSLPLALTFVIALTTTLVGLAIAWPWLWPIL